jgi:predicted transcriptional regulator
MSALEITINLPDNLAREAEALGLLTPESLIALLRAEIERRARAREVEAIRQGMDEFERGEALPARAALEELKM